MSVKTYWEYLEDVITGKAERPKCCGFLSQQKHDVVEYELHLGGQWFSFACPKCGYGTGGSIDPKARDHLLDVLMKQEKKKDAIK